MADYDVNLAVIVQVAEGGPAGVVGALAVRPALFGSHREPAPVEPAPPDRVALDRLTRTLETWPTDAEGWTAIGLVRGLRGHREGRLAAVRRAHDLRPGSELVVSERAAAESEAGDRDAALAAASEWVRMSPTAVEPLLLRAGVYSQGKDWPRADCRSALTIHPLHPQARLMLAVCHHHQGDPAAGRAAADTAAGLATHPRQRMAMLDWYRARTR